MDFELDDKISDWKRQIGQASEYGYYFDWQTVNEMFVELVRLKNENEKLKVK